nr:MAG TPA: minor tail protein [Bacteriophage sp.]
MAADGSIIIDTKLDTSGIDNGVSRIKQSFNSLGSAVKKIGLLIGGAFAVGKLVQFGKECVALGSDLAEVQNVVDVTFTTMSDKVNEFAKNAMVSAGLSETMAKRYVGTFGAMSKSFGFSEAQAYDMSTALTQLTGDVASFYNISQDLAYIKLKSVFTGETETLKDLGVVMTQSALDQYALANGYGKTTSAMTEQEKVALRLKFVQDQLSAASGDFIRTSDSWANQVRVMQLQLQSLKATVGQGLINIFTPVLKVINILLGKLATLANAFKSFTELITGKKSSGQTSGSGAGLSGTDVIADTADAYGDAADNAEKMADATNDNAKATKKANKETKNYLSSLDEIHKATSTDSSSSTPSSAGGSGGGASGGLSGAVNNVDYGSLAEGETALDKMSKPLEKIIKKLKKLAKLLSKGFWDGLGDYEPIFDDIKENIDSIGKSLQNIFTDPEVIGAANNFLNVFAYSVGKTAGSFARIGITIAQNIIGGIEKFLKQNTGRIKKYLIDMFNIGSEISGIKGNLSIALADIFSVFGGEIAQQITANIIGIFSNISMTAMGLCARLGRDMLNMIAQPFIDNKDILKSAVEGTLGVIETITDGLSTVIQNLSDSVTALYDEHLKPFFDSIANGLSTIFGTLIDGYNTYILPVLQGLASKIKELMDGELGEMFVKVQTFLGKLIDILKELWENILVPIISWIVSNAIPVIADVANVIGSAAIEAIKSVIKIIGDVLDVLSGILDFLKGVFTGDWELAWNGIKEIARGVWNLIKDIISGVWETIKGIVKSALTIIKSIISLAWNAIKTVTITVWNAIKTWLFNTWEAIKTTVSTVFDGIKSKITRIWDSVSEKTSSIWGKIKTFVDGKVSAIHDAIVDKFTSARDTVVRAFEGIRDTIKDILNKVIGIANSAIGTVNSAIGGIESAFTFGPWKVPTPFGSRTIGFTANFPRVPTIPYLAKGAVIPPRSEFLAVLGDQKQGNNIETPEALLRKIVREESGGQNSGGNVRFTAQINRRTVFDEMIEEAKLRRDASGTNPFELA